MAKRFTDTNKYKKPFIRGLQGAYKLLWDYLYHDCDHAGIWIVDFEIAQICVGSDMPINEEDALKCFNKDEQRIVVINNGSKWFIPSFVKFQYGILNPENRAHRSVINILQSHNLCDNKGLITPLQGCKDKDKEMDKEIKEKKEVKHIHGEYKHVRLTENQLNKLYEDFGKEKTDKAIIILDEYIETSGKKYKNYYLVLRKWPMERVESEINPQKKYIDDIMKKIGDKWSE